MISNSEAARTPDQQKMRINERIDHTIHVDKGNIFDRAAVSYNELLPTVNLWDPVRFAGHSLSVNAVYFHKLALLVR